MKLEDYSITPHSGFLTPYDMSAVRLPPVFAAIEEAGRGLSGFLTSGRCRHFLDALPEIDPSEIEKLDDAQLRLLMVRYSFIVQAYVWGEPQVPERLPRNLAVPYCALAGKIGQFPLLPYSAYTLDNWVKLDPKGDVALDNIAVIQNFVGGQDENWFILVHVEIEARAGAALAVFPAVLEAAEKEDINGLRAGLQTILAAWEIINPVFGRMPERCDPYIYYNRVRPYIHGWKDNPALVGGLVYEGVEKYAGQGQVFRGQTGSQSSIVPAMDALLGIRHRDDVFRRYLDELHAYRPPGHRRFIEDTARRSKIRDLIVKTGDAQARELYNACVAQIEKFRTSHLEYAASYINKQAAHATGNPVDIGTGGTPFMKYLKKHRDESGEHMIAA